MRGKNPTRRQMAIIEQHRLKPANWLVVKNLPDALHLKHRHTGRRRVLKLGRRAG
ncbi:DUF6906 family protein [Desulfoscipio geothermicus]|uniref:DUF6906 domain-containing protein n=1 Tax=Desulfoscipio geothermicus DSM 3669 TaxID=1121426 RepID=A0A1I6EC96_9FIRM|nr:hypothetical protein SAMN05660706_13537 [Desulfoscipio geothermicus DSM 3669]